MFFVKKRALLGLIFLVNHSAYLFSSLLFGLLNCISISLRALLYISLSITFLAISSLSIIVAKETRTSSSVTPVDTPHD